MILFWPLNVKSGEEAGDEGQGLGRARLGPAPGPKMNRYGGNTSCVQVTLDSGEDLILDAGTGIRSLASTC